MELEAAPSPSKPCRLLEINIQKLKTYYAEEEGL